MTLQTQKHDKETQKAAPLLIEWKALCSPGRHLHWIHITEIPESVRKVAVLTGRQVKDDDGVWRNMSRSNTHGKVPLLS